MEYVHTAKKRKWKQRGHDSITHEHKGDCVPGCSPVVKIIPYLSLNLKVAMLWIHHCKGTMGILT